MQSPILLFSFFFFIVQNCSKVSSLGISTTALAAEDKTAPQHSCVYSDFPPSEMNMHVTTPIPCTCTPLPNSESLPFKQRQLTSPTEDDGPILGCPRACLSTVILASWGKRLLQWQTMQPRIEYIVQSKARLGVAKTRPSVREMQQPPTVGHRMALASHKAASKHAKKPDS